MRVVPVIMSGGIGSRLWPLSTEDSPKQFQSFIGDKTLLQQTVERILDLNLEYPPIFITQEKYRFLIQDQLKGYCPHSKIILEPFGKNTGPASAVASYYIQSNFPDSIAVIFPCDHLISNDDQFKDSIKNGIKSAKQKKIVTFGIKPTKLHTGYGYIQQGLKNQNGSYEVKSFHEKPSAQKAQQYLKDSSFFWNSGIYMFKPEILLKEFSSRYGSIVENSINSLDNHKQDGNFLRLNKQEFSKNEDISIDVAVMENTTASVLVELHSKWSDLGSWDSIYEASKKDANNNVLEGNIYLQDTVGSFIKTKKKNLISIGLKDVLIVETEDDLFISPIAMTNSIKSILDKIGNKLSKKDSLNRINFRPWGSYKVIDEGENFLVKKIIVKRNSKLSLQTHKHRSENWVVVKGKAKVTCEEKEIILEKDSAIFIPMGAKHRLENIGDCDLEVIEVQSGNHLSESDIERIEDDYNR